VKRQDEPVSEPAKPPDKPISDIAGCQDGDPISEAAARRDELVSAPAKRRDELIFDIDRRQDKPKSETEPPFADGGVASAVCPACGARFYGGKDAVAGGCPYCGGALTAEERAAESPQPDYIIPFKRSKEEAMSALGAFCAGKKLLPDSFVAENQVTSARGVYVPFRLFDAKAGARMCLNAVKIFGIRTSVLHIGYDLIREADCEFKNVPASASEKMPHDYMDTIEPFNYSEMMKFNTSFLDVYLAEMFDADAERGKRRFEGKAKETVETEFRKSAYGYRKVTCEDANFDFKEGERSTALFPVWALNAEFEGDNYLFAVNGQTGRIAGKLPVDRAKVWKCGASAAAAFGAAFVPIAYALHLWIRIPLFIPMFAALAAAAFAGRAIVGKREREMDATLLDAGADDCLVPGSVVYKTDEDIFLLTLPQYDGNGNRRLFDILD
jgi:predicted  nucleic acid-binding Zn-ribbon protein